MKTQNEVRTSPTPSSAPSRRSSPTPDELPPAIIVGGKDNALSLIRDLGRLGVQVHVANDPTSEVLRSRYARRAAIASEKQPWVDATREYLLGPASDALAGAVLLAASDEALELFAKHRDSLAVRFVLDSSNPDAQLAMLDKLTTYQIATKAGVPTPMYWSISKGSDLRACRDQYVYPLIVKPKLSHLFQQRFHSKFIVANDFDELLRAFEVVEQAGIDVLLVEKIPGPDDQLCSYYTYMDESGSPLFDFTKRIIRRHPENMGLACYHVTDYVPDVKTEAVKLFKAAGLLGVANAEFKLDTRDGKLKLIECNARFTAANRLLTAAGINLSSFVYHRLIGRPHDLPTTYRVPLYMWDPGRDILAFRELNAQGKLGFAKWLRSVAHRQVFPSFSWDDPTPSVARLRKRLGKLFAKS